MHTQLKPSGRTPFQIVGELVRLQSQGAIAPEFEFPEAASWTPDIYRKTWAWIKDLALAIWNELGIQPLTFGEAHRRCAVARRPCPDAKTDFAEIRERLAKMEEPIQTIAQVIWFADAKFIASNRCRVANLARLAVKAPADVDCACIRRPVWQFKTQRYP